MSSYKFARRDGTKEFKHQLTFLVSERQYAFLMSRSRKHHTKLSAEMRCVINDVMRYDELTGNKWHGPEDATIADKTKLEVI